MAGYLSIAVFLIEVTGVLDSNPRDISTCIVKAKRNERHKTQKRLIELAEHKWNLAEIDIFCAEACEPEQSPQRDGENEAWCFHRQGKY
jgi:hypothetical protein